MSTKFEAELVRGENNKLLGFSTGSGVTALAGVASLVSASSR